MEQLKGFPWKRKIWKVILVVIVIAITSYLLNSAWIANELAMGQMENSDEAFLALDIYNQIKGWQPTVYLALTCWLCISLGIDIYKYINKNKKENDK